MRTIKLTGFIVFVITLGFNPLLAYQSLDTSDPIDFQGNHLIYQGQRIDLDPKAFFIDAQLTAQEAAAHPYVFNSINEACAHLTAGTEDDPHGALYRTLCLLD